MHIKSHKTQHVPALPLRSPDFRQFFSGTHKPTLFKKPKLSRTRVKIFAREYSLPLVVTVLFFVAIGAVAGLRASERSALLELLPSISIGGQDYASFVSGDKADEFTKNQDNADAAQGGTTVRAPTPAGTASSLSINTGGTPSTGGGTTGGGSTGGGTVVLPFSSSIASFAQSGGGTLECNGQQVIPKCSKRYTFDAGVRTSNGPGIVSYSWRSNLSSANQDAGFSVGGGTVVTPLQKQIVIPCKDGGTYTLQLVLNSPTPTQSAVLSLNHSCAGI